MGALTVARYILIPLQTYDGCNSLYQNWSRYLSIQSRVCQNIIPLICT